MAEVLSQTEIDALLAAVSSGNVQTEETPTVVSTEKGSTDWIAYDLTSQEKIVRGRLAALQGIHERFSRMFRATLSQNLKKSVSVTCTNTDFIRFSDYLQNVLLPTSFNIINMINIKGHMIFVLSSKLAYALVDAYYGGSERPFSKIGGREEFTSIENNMIKKICMLALKDMSEAWKLNYPLELEYVRSEANPHFVGAIHSSETVAVVSFEVEFENLSGTFVLVLQVRALDAIQQALAVNVTAEVSEDSSVWMDHWLRELGTLEVEMRASLGSAERTLAQMQSIKVGDEMILLQDAAAPLTISIEGLPKIKGLMGTCRGNAAIRVTDLDEPKNNRKS